MASPANDTFVEAADTTLASHAPTGSGAGAGWDVLVSGASIKVIASTDLCQEQSNSNGNRYRMTSDLTSDAMDVQADISTTGAGTTFPGVAGRVPNSGTGATGWEFIYDVASGKWNLSDGTTIVTLSESVPVGVKTYKLSCRASGQTGYVDGVQKCTTASNTKTGNTRGGILLGNFGGGAINTMTLDNYQSAKVAAAGWGPLLGLARNRLVVAR